MAGPELVGDIERAYVERLFNENTPAVLYRYHPKAHFAQEFETRIAERLGVGYAHLVSSGTAAIETALYAAGVKPGDEVIVTAFTFLAPIESILRLGAIPVCVDIDDTYHSSVETVEQAITDRTAAVCVVPMWGACDMDGLVSLCRDRGIRIVEDSAQALAGSYKGRTLGTFGTAASFSLDAGKTLTAGEGGFVVTNDETVYDRAAAYSDHGHMHMTDRPRGKDGVVNPGANYRASELTAAIALGQLERLDDILIRQRARYARLTSEIARLNNVSIRKTSDPQGELCDTLILTFTDSTTATQVADDLLAQGVGTKILPEAFDWHFAGAWTHIWDRVPGSDAHIARVDNWSRTRALLERSVALPVSVHENPEWDAKVLKVLSAV